jgi:hypothetical protein
MQKYVQEKYNIKCSRASLSRRIREMGFTRGIIRRGFRAEDQQVPQISPADMIRIMGDPSPDEDVLNLPPNAKRARYAWLLDGERPAKRTKKPNKKKDGEAAKENGDVDDATDAAHQVIEHIANEVTPQGQAQQHQQQAQSQPSHQQMSPNAYPQSPLYISPYRQVTANGGLIINGHPMESTRNMGQHMSPNSGMPLNMA